MVHKINILLSQLLAQVGDFALELLDQLVLGVDVGVHDGPDEKNIGSKFLLLLPVPASSRRTRPGCLKVTFSMIKRLVGGAGGALTDDD